MKKLSCVVLLAALGACVAPSEAQRQAAYCRDYVHPMYQGDCFAKAEAMAAREQQARQFTSSQLFTAGAMVLQGAQSQPSLTCYQMGGGVTYCQ